MAVNEKLTARVREMLAGVPRVAEKRMFRGIAFMVDDKMCVSVGDDRIMCRIDPDRHAEAVRKPGCRTVEMGGRPYLGFVYVDEKRLASAKELRAWVDLALDFNPRAKSSKRPKADRPRKAEGSEGGGAKTKRGKPSKPDGRAGAQGTGTRKGAKPAVRAKTGGRNRKTAG